MHQQANQESFSHRLSSVTEVVLHGAARMLEIQTAAAQAVFRAQGRNLAMFGGPDWTPLFERNGQHVASLIQTSTEQGLALFRLANQAFLQVQHQIGDLVEQQTMEVAQSAQRALEEINQSAGRSLEQARETGQAAFDYARQGLEEQGHQVGAAAGQMREAGRERNRALARGEDGGAEPIQAGNEAGAGPQVEARDPRVEADEGRDEGEGQRGKVILPRGDAPRGTARRH